MPKQGYFLILTLEMRNGRKKKTAEREREIVSRMPSVIDRSESKKYKLMLFSLFFMDLGQTGQLIMLFVQKCNKNQRKKHKSMKTSKHP